MSDYAQFAIPADDPDDSTVVLASAGFGALDLDAVERRIALYFSELPLSRSLRGNRARLVEIIERGIELIGRFELLDGADAYRALVRHAHRDHCTDCQLRLVELWPDRTRSRLARTLAQSPVWDPSDGRAGH